MKKLKIDFLIAVAILTAIAYFIAGGPGMIVLGFLGFGLRLAPFRQGHYSPSSDPAYGGDSIVQVFIKKTANHMPVIPPRDGSPLVLVDLLVCFGIIVFGVGFWVEGV